MALADLDLAHQEGQLQTEALDATKEAFDGRTHAHLVEREAWIRSLEETVATQRNQLFSLPKIR